MSGKIFSGGALTLDARWTRNVSGLVAASVSRAMIPTTTVSPTSFNTDPPLAAVQSGAAGHRRSVREPRALWR
jgi:hypothetical protein